MNDKSPPNVWDMGDFYIVGIRCGQHTIRQTTGGFYTTMTAKRYDEIDTTRRVAQRLLGYSRLARWTEVSWELQGDTYD